MSDHREPLATRLLTAIASLIGIRCRTGIAAPAIIARAPVAVRRLSERKPLPDPDMHEYWPEPYDPMTHNQEFGRSVEYGRIPYRIVGRCGAELWADVAIPDEDVMAFLRADAEAHLPPATRYEVRKALASHGTSYGKPDPDAQRYSGRHKMAWYRTEREGLPKTDDIPDFGAGPFGPVDTDVRGYILMGQFVTPAPNAGGVS